MDMNFNLEQIEKHVARIKEAIEDKPDSTDWEGPYSALLHFMEEYIEDTQALYENMKEEGLMLGIAEAEGALRAVKTLSNTARELIDTYNPKETDGHT